MELPAHQLTTTVLMTPDTANFAGNVHGGTILKLLDQAAVDDDRKPMPVPPLRPFTPDEKRRHAAAIVRKALRQEFQRRAAGTAVSVSNSE